VRFWISENWGFSNINSSAQNPQDFRQVLKNRMGAPEKIGKKGQTASEFSMSPEGSFGFVSSKLAN